MKLLEDTINKIHGEDKIAVKKAWRRIDNLTKPIGSLGKIEKIAAKISGITGKVHNRIRKKNIIIMCADNGIWEEGIGSCRQELTAHVTNNFIKGVTGVCVLSDFYGSDKTVVDIGIKGNINNPGVINRKINNGTRNMTKGPAMDRNEAVEAIEAGIEITENLCKKGYDLLGTGEMGVCNTATSAAVLSVLTGISPDGTAGKGSGITEEQFIRKINAIKKSIAVNKPKSNDVIDVLSKIGGFDLCGICGCFLGAAKNRTPIVIDGFISSVAALCAVRLNPKVKDFLFPSHLSAEPGARYIMDELNLEPMLNLDMRLGEGSGCPFAFSIIEAALYTVENMATFEEANIDDSQLVDIRKDN